MKEPVGEESTTPALVRAALQASGVSTAGAAEAVSLGNRKETYLIDRAAGGVVVQTSEDRQAIQTEAAVLERIANATTVPVPTVRASGVTDSGAYLVTDRIDGESLHYRFAALESTQQRGIARSFGRHLGTLHELFDFDGVGELSVVDGELRARADTNWQSWFESYACEAIDRLPAAFDDIRNDLRAAIDTEGTPPEPALSLFPWDFRPGNALAREGSLVGIVDWERPLAAAPALSVAKAEYLVADWYVENPVPLRQAFTEGYESVRPRPKRRASHRIAAIASSAVDSRGTVTNPRYPELDRNASIEFHYEALQRAL